MAIDPVVNFGKVLVSQGYAASDTAIVLLGGQGTKLPTASTQGAYNVVYWNSTDYPDPSDDPNVEIVRVTVGGGADGDTLTVIRAQEGTAASSKNLGGKIYRIQLALTAKMIADLSGSLVPAGQGIPLTGSGTTWSTGATTPSSAFSFIVDTGSGQFMGYVGGNYSISGTTITFTSPVPAGYNSLILICVG